MANKLTPRQQAQLAWLELLPPKLARMKKVIELLSTHQADDTQLRGLTRMLDELKAQASSLTLTPLADGFGFMGTLVRRAGGHQMKVRGLQELLAGVRTNFEGAFREASTPQAAPAEDNVSP